MGGRGGGGGGRRGGCCWGSPERAVAARFKRQGLDVELHVLCHEP